MRMRSEGILLGLYDTTLEDDGSSAMDRSFDDVVIALLDSLELMLEVK